MNYILFDTPQTLANLKPFTFTRPVSEIRIGILTIREKWEKFLEKPISFLTEDYLQDKYPLQIIYGKDNVYINSSICPNKDLVDEIHSLQRGDYLEQKGILIAYRTGKDAPKNSKSVIKDTTVNFTIIQSITDIFAYNAVEIKSDFQLITKNRISQSITDPHVITYQPENIFIEDGAKMKACILNAEKGVIYIGKDTEIGEGTVIRGNFALCEGSIINPGAKMRGDTTIGPFCKIGGEISNSVIFGYSNKSHDGFLGNSVLGEWCNLGADTNSSNLKNNYSQVKIWNYAQEKYLDTGRQFVGLMMGDHSKAGINTMFNTGTVVGFSANIFGGGFPPKYIPSFAWGGANGFEIFALDKAIETAENMMARRNMCLSESDKNIFKEIFQQAIEIEHAKIEKKQ